MLEEKDLQAIAQLMDMKLQPIKQDINEIKARVPKIEVIQENDTSKRLDLVMEAQQEAAAKLQKLGRIESTFDTEIIKSVVTEHNKSIREPKAVK